MKGYEAMLNTLIHELCRPDREIQNGWGLFLSLVAFAMWGVVAIRRSSQEESLADGDIYRRSAQLVSPAVPGQFGWLCSELGYVKDRTSPSEYRWRRESYDGSLSLWQSWCVKEVDIIVAAEGPDLVRAAKKSRPRRFPWLSRVRGRILSRPDSSNPSRVREQISPG